jgi:O-antigen ligase
MGNFHIVSLREQVSHNAYTQVSAELGLPALVLYVLLMWAALKRLRQIERETLSAERRSPFYYLAIGLQASLIGYMVSSFFASVAFLYYLYYPVGYAVCLHFMYQSSQAQAAGASGTQERAFFETGKGLPSHVLP